MWTERPDDDSFIIDYELWRSPDGQVWTVTIDNDGQWVIEAIQERITENESPRLTEDGRQRITEG